MESDAQAIQVTILTQTQCAFCEQAQDLLARLAGEFPLRITTVPLATPEGRDLALKGGMLFAPGIFIDGTPICYGRPSERKLRRELERMAQRKRSSIHVP